MAIGNFLGGVADQRDATRLMDIKERAVAADEKNNLVSEADKNIAATMKIANDVITNGQQAGRTPDQIKKALQPLLADISDLSLRTGRNPQTLLNQVDALVSSPGVTKAAQTEIGKLGEDLTAGKISPEDYAAAKDKATRGDSTMENIRSKMARGIQITPGEKQVYDDGIKAEGNNVVNLLKGLGVITPDTTASASTTPIPGITPGVPADATPVKASITPSFASEEQARKALADGRIKVGDIITLKGQQVRIQ